MIKYIKMFFISVLFMLFLGSSFAVPNFDDFTDKLDDKVYKNIAVNKDASLKENIYSLFYPTSDGQIWNILRRVAVGFMLIILVWAGFLLMFHADDESKLKSAKKNFVYLLYGAFLFFGVTWILGSALEIGNVSGSSGFVSNLKNQLIFKVLAFLKAAAFFVAIIMILYYGFGIVRAYDQEDKIKSARKGAINVIVALIFIKVIDYIYLIAQDTTSFKTKASSFIVSTSKVALYVLGALLLLAIFYAGGLLVTSRGDEEKWKKAKTIVQTVFLVGVIVMLFLLIVYQVLSEVG